MALQQTIGRPIALQKIAYDATVAVTNPFGAQTYNILLTSNTNCHFHIYDVGGTAAAVAATDTLLPQLTPLVVAVTPGQKISAIKAASEGAITAAAGTLWITELA